MHVKHLDHLNMSVSNLEESLAWYARVFGFKRVEGGVRNGVAWAIVRAGEAMLCLYEHAGRARPDPMGHNVHGLSHFALRITDREAWVATVEREQLELEWDGEVTWPNSTAWYVLDPTGYEIEVALWQDDTVRFPAAATA